MKAWPPEIPPYTSPSLLLLLAEGLPWWLPPICTLTPIGNGSYNSHSTLSLVAIQLVIFHLTLSNFPTMRSQTRIRMDQFQIQLLKMGLSLALIIVPIASFRGLWWQKTNQSDIKRPVESTGNMLGSRSVESINSTRPTWLINIIAHKTIDGCLSSTGWRSAYMWKR